jgi:hypothetical protein
LVLGTGLAGVSYNVATGSPVTYTPMGPAFWISYAGLILCIIITLASYVRLKFHTNSFLGGGLIAGYFVTVIPSIIAAEVNRFMIIYS